MGQIARDLGSVSDAAQFSDLSFLPLLAEQRLGRQSPSQRGPGRRPLTGHFSPASFSHNPTASSVTQELTRLLSSNRRLDLQQ